MPLPMATGATTPGPLQLFRRHLDSVKIFDDTIQAVLIRNERPVADAFRDAARQVNAINAG